MDAKALYDKLVNISENGTIADVVVRVGGKRAKLSRQYYIEDEVFYLLVTDDGENTAFVQSVIDSMITESKDEAWVKVKGLMKYSYFYQLPVRICTKADIYDEEAEILDICDVVWSGNEVVLECTDKKKFKIKITQTWEHTEVISAGSREEAGEIAGDIAVDMTPHDGTMHFGDEWIDVWEVE